MADPVLLDMVADIESSLMQPLAFPPRGDLVDDIGELDKFSPECGDFGLDIDGNLNAVKSLFAHPPSLLRKYGILDGNKQTDDLILGPHEMQVCGTRVDDRIMPGFKYQVRILSKKRHDRFQFEGRALCLKRIGQGYGKRLVFESQSFNDNPNYFWSDTLPNGYAFTINAVQPEDEFVLCQQNQNCRPFGHATVITVSPDQIEISSKVEDGKNVVKRVLVSMCVTVRYMCEPHGMRSLRPNEIVDVMGVAVVTKGPGRSKAVTRCIEEVQIPGHGECLLYREED